MKTFSSIIPKHDCVMFTKSELLEDSSFRYHDIGWLSANLCFKFMEVMEIDEDGEMPYSFLCRFLKGSIPAWRLSGCPWFRSDSEAYIQAVKLRKFLRMVRNFDASLLTSYDIVAGVNAYTLVNARTGRSLAYIHKY